MIMKMLSHHRMDKARRFEAGGVAFTLFAAVALVGVLGAGAMTVMKGPVSSMSKVTKRAVAENTLLVGGKLAVAAAMAQGDGGDCDGDGMVEPLEWGTTGTGTAPSGGGFVPSTLSITATDPWGTSFGYCVWDHGGDIKNGDCVTTNRRSGQADANGTLVAIMSAGPDKKFQTTCGDAPTYVTRAQNSDDSVLTYTLTEIQAQMGGIWNLKTGDATTAEIAKTLEVKDSGGDVNFSLDMGTGLGDFIGLMVGSIKGKLTAPVSMGSGLKLDNDTNVTSCVAGEEGFLRYHATNGVEVCDGSAYVPAGSGEGGEGGYSYSGLYGGKISAAQYHSCGLRSDGAAYCWGSNTMGQLGDGTTTQSISPKIVNGGHKFVQIYAGDYYGTCGLRTDGAAYCWGDNSTGNLGDGTSVNRSVPTAVSGGHKFVSISMGSYHTCGIRTDGAAYCWGNNGNGRLGDGTTTNRNVPIAVIGGHKFVSITTGFNNTCAIRIDGAAYCWGDNFSGQLGDGTTTGRTSPTPVSVGQAFVQVVAAINYSCGISTDGEAYCWGSNGNGQLGDGTTTNRNVPTAVIGGHKFIRIAPGSNHTCGIRTDGAAHCWGSGASGRLGDGTTTQRIEPAAVSAPGNFIEIDSGMNHTCGLRTDGSAYCWGSNGASGRLGDGTTTDRSIPTHVVGFSMLDYQQVPYQFGDDGVACAAGLTGTVRYHATNGLEVCNGTSYSPLVASSGPSTQYRYNGLHEGKIAAGAEHTCVVRQDGAAYCWGENSFGQLGNNSTVDTYPPVAVTGNHRFSQLSASFEHTCGLRTNGDILCWGEGSSGRLGNGASSDSLFPVVANGSHKFVQVSAGGEHTCGLRTDGAIYCWGLGTSGRIGDGTANSRTSPTLVAGSHKFVQVSSGGNHSCGIRSDGAAYCWGANVEGQLGDGTSSDRTSPALVAGGHLWAKITASEEFTCGLRMDGAAYCWGRGGNGRLGDGSESSVTSPVAVTGGHVFQNIITGYSFTCGVTNAGSTYCWGYNGAGQIADGTSTDRLTPTFVAGAAGLVTLAAADHVCGIKGDGGILCWGYNSNGQVGDGTATNRYVPTNVAGISILDLQGSSFQFGNDATACSASNVGTLRYVSPATWQYCNGTAWGAF